VLKGGLEFPAEALVGIGSHSLALLHDRVLVGNFTHSGEGLLDGEHHAVSKKVGTR
jgi:hypothetical protein